MKILLLLQVSLQDYGTYARCMGPGPGCLTWSMARAGRAEDTHKEVCLPVATYARGIYILRW